MLEYLHSIIFLELVPSNDKFSLFIGIGFLVNVLIDFLHVTVSLLNMDNILFLKYFIPQTWFAGRLFLSAMLAIAISQI